MQIIAEQLRDECARNDHALVHVELVALQPGLVEQVGSGQALLHSPLDVLQQTIDLAVRQVRIGEKVEALQRELQRAHDDERRFLERIGLAMAKRKVGLVEARYRISQHIAKRPQIGLGVDCHFWCCAYASSNSRVRRYTFFSSSRSETAMCSSILWIDAFGGPNSITCEQNVEMKRPSDVPPVVEMSGLRPVTSEMARMIELDRSPGGVMNGRAPSVH